MMEPREEVLDSPTGHCVETAVHTFLDAVTKHARRVVYLSLEGVCHHLEQQPDTITARIAAKRTA